MKILTFDIEEWFHILDHTETRSVDSWQNYDSRLREGIDRILQVLSDSNQRATFFCLGWVAENHPDVIRDIDNAGYEIASHSFAHQLAFEQTRDEFRKDLRRSLHVLQDITGRTIDTYRAPGFSIIDKNLWAFEELIKEDIAVDCSLFPANRAHGGLPEFGEAVPTTGNCGGHKIKLLPINTREIFGKKIIYSGGGYFRVIPGPLLRKWFRDDDYVMTYFHPRDFDPDQPLVPGLSAVRRFKSYAGIRGAIAKLRRLLEVHKFVDVRTASDLVDWAAAPEIELGPT